jgi:hypothetical protein
LVDYLLLTHYFGFLLGFGQSLVSSLSPCA